MADLEIDDNVREKFAYLFKPVTDLGANFAIDIIELLRDFDNKTVDADTGFNFVNAAAMLQGTTGVYGRKVDLLHKAVVSFKTDFSNQPTTVVKRSTKRTNNEEEGGECSMADDDNDDDRPQRQMRKKTSRLGLDEPMDTEGITPFPNQRHTLKVIKVSRNGHYLAPCTLLDCGIVERDPGTGLTIFERFHINRKAHYPLYISTGREFQLIFHMPGNMLPLLQNEKRPIELFGKYGKYGELDDYRLCRDLVIYNFAMYCNKGGNFCYELRGEDDPCEAVTKQVYEFLKSASLLPSNFVFDNDMSMHDHRRSSLNIVEICRRISEGDPGSDFINRLSEHVELFDPVSGNTFIPATQEHPLDMPKLVGANASFGMSMDGDAGADHYSMTSFATVPPIGEALEPRRSSRLRNQTTTNATAPIVIPCAPDEFAELDLYDEQEYKNKPFRAVRRRVQATTLISRRDAADRRKAIEDGKDPVFGLQAFLDDCVFNRGSLKLNARSAPCSVDMMNACLANAKRREIVRRFETKMEIKRKRMLEMRTNKRAAPAGTRRSTTQLAAVVANHEDVLLENTVRATTGRDIDDECYDEGLEADATSQAPVSASVRPLGDVFADDIPDNFPTYSDVSRMSVRSRRSIIQNEASLVDGAVLAAPTSLAADDNDGLSQPVADMIPANADIGTIMQIYLSRKWNHALKQQPERIAKLAVWEKKMIPILSSLSDDYLAHEYGKKVLEMFEGDVGRKIWFSKITKGHEHERSRFFLAVLMLINRGVLLILPQDLTNKENADPSQFVDDGVPLDCQVELLNDADWQGDEMNASGLFS